MLGILAQVTYLLTEAPKSELKAFSGSIMSCQGRNGPNLHDMMKDFALMKKPVQVIQALAPPQEGLVRIDTRPQFLF